MRETAAARRSSTGGVERVAERIDEQRVHPAHERLDPGQRHHVTGMCARGAEVRLLAAGYMSSGLASLSSSTSTIFMLVGVTYLPALREQQKRGAAAAAHPYSL
jgi:hypothetical protein